MRGGLDGADRQASGEPKGFGRFLVVCGAGLKHETRVESDYREAVRRLARVAARATAPLALGVKRRTA